MTSFLRPLAYRYRWIYDTVTAVSSLSVGGVERLRGLGLEAVQLEGQLLPGLSLVRPLSAADSAHQGLPIITFPGNLGVAGTLREAWQRMEAG